jgi:hypothetical protein
MKPTIRPTQEQLKDEFEGLNEALVNHELPVIDRAAAVLELWDKWDKLKTVEKPEK